MATIAVPLSPDVREALVARLAPTLGSRHARREVARAAAGQPSAEVQAALAELMATPTAAARAARLYEITVVLLTEVVSLASATAPHLPEGAARDEYVAHVGRLHTECSEALKEVANA